MSRHARHDRIMIALRELSVTYKKVMMWSYSFARGDSLVWDVDTGDEKYAWTTREVEAFLVGTGLFTKETG